MNFVSRGLVSLSFIVVEYTEQPIYIILCLSIITLGVTLLIKEPNHNLEDDIEMSDNFQSEVSLQKIDSEK